jgi:DNA polymerase-1
MPIAVDTETTGLRVDIDKIIGMCFSYPPWDTGIYCPMYNTPEGDIFWKKESTFKELIEFFHEILTSPGVKFMHNKHYDTPIIFHNWDIMVVNVICTLLMIHTYNPDHELGLKESAVKYIHPEADWYEQEKDRYNFAVGGGIESPKLWLIPLTPIGQYGASDTVFTGRIESHVRQRMEPQLLWLYEQLVMPLSDELMDIRIHGCPIDTEYLRGVQVTQTAELEATKQQICEMLGDPEFNPASHDQVRDALFDKLKLPGGKIGKKGFSTDKDEMERLRGMHPVSDKILDYRGTEKLKSTYCDGLLNDVGPDGAFRGDVKQWGTRTGRISASRIHQIPRGPLIRSAFVAGDGYVLVGGDHEQLEARVLGHESQDEQLCGAFQRGEDVHSTTTKLMWAEEFANISVEDIKKKYPERRQAGKAVNFALFYLETIAGLKRQVGCDWEEAKDLYNRFHHSSYTDILPWSQRLIEEARLNGFVEMISGRKRYLPELASPEVMYITGQEPPRWPPRKGRPPCYAMPRFKGGIGKSLHYDLSIEIWEWTESRARAMRPILSQVKSHKCAGCDQLWGCYYMLDYNRIQKEGEHFERIVCNSKIQGSAGDITNLGIVRTGRMLREQGIKPSCILMNYVHDEVIYRIRTDMNVDQFVKDYQRCMESPSEYLTVPLIFQPQVGNCWADVK